MKKVYCFGDSWGRGDELNFEQGEKPFSELIANDLGCKFINFSQSNMSLGLIVRQISQIAGQITSDHLILVVIPPDSRWYTEWKTLKYEKTEFFNDKSNEWFKYHHQLFIFSICELLEKTKCKYLLMHNYGIFPLLGKNYQFSQYYKEKFLSKRSLTELLTQGQDHYHPIEIEQRQGSEIFYGPYFEGCICHPNQLGHQRIAYLIKKKIFH